MLTALLFILAIGFALIGGVLWLRQREITKLEAMQALAARRGWSLNASNQTLGRPAVLRLSARSGSHWQAETRSTAPTTPLGGGGTQTTDFRGPEPVWANGLMVIGTSDQDSLIEQSRSMLEGSESNAGQRLLGQAAGANVLPMIDDLSAHEAPDGFMILATEDPSRVADLKDIAKQIREWPAQRNSEKGQPVVILGPDGLRMRLGHGTSTADQMEQFIDLALAIGRIIERP